MLNRNYSGTPEFYMNTPEIKKFGDIDIDALIRSLDRAEALCLLLGAEFEGTTDRLNDNILLHAVDALEAIISQAQLIVNPPTRNVAE